MLDTADNASARLLAEVRSSFVHGAQQPISETAASSGQRYGELLRARVGTRLPDGDWPTVERYLAQQGEALAHARAGRLDESRRRFDALLDTLRTGPLSPIARLLTEAFLAPAEAYLHYRLEDYSRARSLLARASALDNLLVDEQGFAELSAHRLQLGHNVMRIHARLGEIDQAVTLGASLLDYLELRTGFLSAALVSPRSALDSVPDDILDHYFDKIAGELARLLAGRSDPPAAAAFERLRPHAGGCSAKMGVHAHAWLRVKRLACDGPRREFWRAAVALMSRGRGCEPALFDATVLETIAALRSAGVEAVALADWLTGQLSDARRSGRSALDDHPIGGD